jgi:hypothetical protein
MPISCGQPDRLEAPSWRFFGEGRGQGPQPRSGPPKAAVLRPVLAEGTIDRAVSATADYADNASANTSLGVR